MYNESETVVAEPESRQFLWLTSNSFLVNVVILYSILVTFTVTVAGTNKDYYNH